MTKERELLRRALEAWDCNELNDFSDRMEDIRAILDAPSDDAEEPVAWPIDGEIAQRIAEKQCVSYEVVQLIAREILRLHPPKPAEPARKPMTEEEIDEEIATNEHYCERSFAEGVRFAEKHHGITDADV